jgi:hypothetical protein
MEKQSFMTPEELQKELELKDSSKAEHGWLIASLLSCRYQL